MSGCPWTEGRGLNGAGHPAYTAYTPPSCGDITLPTLTIMHWTLSVPHLPADDNTQVTGGGRWWAGLILFVFLCPLISLLLHLMNIFTHTWTLPLACNGDHEAFSVILKSSGTG